MTLPERRRGFPTYRGPSGAEPARPDAKQAESRGFRISYDDVGAGPPIVLKASWPLTRLWPSLHRSLRRPRDTCQG